MAGDSLLYEIYERRLASQVASITGPRHVGVILDGNRRWAKHMGFDTSHGHQRGAEKIEEFLGWAEDAGVRVVTLWLLSTDNLSRDPAELALLLEIIVHAVQSLARSGRWHLRLVGAVDLLPSDVAQQLRHAVASTDSTHGDGDNTSRGRDTFMRGSASRSRISTTEHHVDRTQENDDVADDHAARASVNQQRVEVNIAVGYGGRQEIADAVRELLRERAASGATLEDVAQSLREEDITAHLYTKGQPDPDLVIRTSGEQRLSGFLLWQSVHSEYYFCEVYWPDFRRIDFLRALRDYSRRERRLGR